MDNIQIKPQIAFQEVRLKSYFVTNCVVFFLFPGLQEEDRGSQERIPESTRGVQSEPRVQGELVENQ